MTTVALITGSLRKGSYSRMTANSLQELAPSSLKFKEVGIGELPFYNEDLEASAPPATWKTFRDGVKSADAVVIVTPEYNRGIPGVVKNAVDVGSRPRVESVWRNKPALVISQTPGKLGAMAANQQLRCCLSVIGAFVMPAPEIYISDASTLFDASGKLIVEDTRKFLSAALQEFATWINKFK